MMNRESWSSAAFVAVSDCLSPEEIQAQIGLTPTRAHKIGDPVSADSTMPVHLRHYFSVQSQTDESESIDRQLEELLSRLEPRVESIRNISSKASLSLFCGLSSGRGQGGFALSPALLSRLAGLGLEVVVNYYAPDSENREGIAPLD